MEVTVAKTAGFCFGVKRAVEKVYDQIGRTEKGSTPTVQLSIMSRSWAISGKRVWRSSTL